MSRRGPAPIIKFTSAWAKLGVRRVSPWHWQTKIYGQTLEIWPGKDKWCFLKETEEGPLDELMAALRSARAIEKKHQKERGQ